MKTPINALTRFRIDYTDPETGQPASHEGDYEDSADPHPISAREWAEDHAYALADKGHYKITEIA